MGGYRSDDDGPVGYPSQDCKMDYRYDGAEGKCQGMVMGLGGRGTGGYRALDYKGYMRRWQATIEEYVAGRPIYDMCVGEESIEGSISLYVKMSHHTLMGRPAARLETMALVKKMYILV